MTIKNILFTTLISFFAISAHAQIQNVFYFNQKGWQVKSKDSCAYYRFISQPDTNVNIFQISEYYNNGKPKLIAKSLKNNGQFLTGDCASYYPNGSLYTIKRYLTQGAIPGSMAENNFTIITCNDSTGKALVSEGNGQYIGYNLYENQGCDFSTIHEEGEVKNGQREGRWKITDNLKDSVLFTETYANGILINGEGFYKGNIIYNYQHREIQPQFKGGEMEFRKFIVRHVKYPRAAKRNNIEGKVFVQFVVEKDGTLTSIKALRSPSDDLAAAAVQAISESPKWVPGSQFGRPVRVQYTVPINFGLNHNL